MALGEYWQKYFKSANSSRIWTSYRLYRRSYRDKETDMPYSKCYKQSEESEHSCLVFLTLPILGLDCTMK